MPSNGKAAAEMKMTSASSGCGPNHCAPNPGIDRDLRHFGQVSGSPGAGDEEQRGCSSSDLLGEDIETHRNAMNRSQLEVKH